MDIVLAVVCVLVLSIILLYLGQRFKLPSIVSYLVIGMLVGPFGFALITDQTLIDTIGQIGIILLLFTIGLEFSFQTLLRSWRAVIIGGLVQVCTTIVAITLITLYFQMPFNEALIFGFIVSLSSTAIVMKILQERGEVDTIQGRTLLGILIFQDLAIIPMMLVLPLLAGMDTGLDLSAVPYQITKIALIILAIIVLGYWVIPRLLFRVAKERSRELFLFTIAGICVVIAWLTSEAGLSFTLGAFIGGLIIGESDYNIDALGHIIPFRDVFAAIFFLSIGMLLNTATVFGNYGYVALIILIIFCVKVLTGAFSAAVLGMQTRVCVFCGLALAQIGEFSFVLAKSGLDAGVIQTPVYQIFLTGAIVTMAFTPFAMNASPKVVDLLYQIFPKRISRVNTGAPDEIAPEEALSNHIIIAGYGLTGKSVARAATLAGIPYMVIELNPEIIREERFRTGPTSSSGMLCRRKCSNMQVSGRHGRSLWQSPRRRRSPESSIRPGSSPPRCISSHGHGTSGTHNTFSISAQTRSFQRSLNQLSKFSPAPYNTTRSRKRRSYGSSNGQSAWVMPCLPGVPTRTSTRRYRILRRSLRRRMSTRFRLKPGLRQKERPSPT